VPIEAGLLRARGDAPADLLLILVRGRAVDVAVARLEGGGDGGRRVLGRDVPRAEAERGNVRQRQQVRELVGGEDGLLAGGRRRVSRGESEGQREG